MENSLLLEELKKKALKEKDFEAIEKLNSKDFVEKINDVERLCKQIDFNLSEKINMIDSEQEIYFKISRALIENYFTIYYVNITTGNYIGYSSNQGYKSLKMEEKGTTFFEDVQVNIERVIYEKDKEIVKKALTKGNFINGVKDGKTFSLSYRLLINNEPVYVTLKALKFSEEDENMIIGVSNIDEQTKRELEYKSVMEQTLTYSNIALSLIKNYFIVYYVNLNNDNYIQYAINSDAQSLEKVAIGKDFFAECQINGRKEIVKEDQDKFVRALERERLLHEIRDGKTFYLTYRQIFDGVPTYVTLSALKLIKDETHIIIAVSNIDEEMKREEEHKKQLEEERLLARTDALTGALNKYSYIEIESFINEKIAKKQIVDFSIVLCDLNDLKKINDTYGHEAGDRYIIEAKKMISDIFKHSSVYRIGGDEFVLILEGSDYYKRDHLMQSMYKKNLEHMKENKAVLACGIADYEPTIDDSVVKVFIRADEKMYENKRALKELACS